MTENTAPQTFADVVNLFASAEALAQEMGELGVTVRQWRNRDNIPAGAWPKLVEVADRLQKPITLQVLSKIAAAKRSAA